MQGWTVRRWMAYSLILRLALFASSLDDLVDLSTRVATYQERAESMLPVMDPWFATKMSNAVQTGENVLERDLAH